MRRPVFPSMILGAPTPLLAWLSLGDVEHTGDRAGIATPPAGFGSSRAHSRGVALIQFASGVQIEYIAIRDRYRAHGGV